MISNRPCLRHIAASAGTNAARPPQNLRIIGTPGEGLRPSTHQNWWSPDGYGRGPVRRWAAIRAGLAGFALAAAGLSGCAGPAPIAETEAVSVGATTVEWTADWDDVPAAVSAALSRAGAASEGMRVYRRAVVPIAAEPAADLTAGVDGDPDGGPDADRAAAAGRPDLLTWEGPEVAVEYDLLLLTGETGVLRIERVAPPADDLGVSTLRPAEPLRATVRLGAFGRPEREAEVLRLIAWRLEQLRGRDAAPFSWPG